MSQIETMRFYLRESPELRVIASPAEELTLVFGYDDDGFADYQTVRVGDHIISQNNKRWMIVGFLTNNNIIVQPAGLDIDPAILWVHLASLIGCKVERDEPIHTAMHRDGLVSFEWAD